MVSRQERKITKASELYEKHGHKVFMGKIKTPTELIAKYHKKIQILEGRDIKVHTKVGIFKKLKEILV